VQSHQRLQSSARPSAIARIISGVVIEKRARVSMRTRAVFQAAPSRSATGVAGSARAIRARMRAPSRVLACKQSVSFHAHFYIPR
jgi:hypothetical protein